VLLIYTSQKLQINPGQTWAAIRTANPLLFLAAFITYYLSFFLRTLRWRVLLENIGYKKSDGAAAMSPTQATLAPKHIR